MLQHPRKRHVGPINLALRRNRNDRINSAISNGHRRNYHTQGRPNPPQELMCAESADVDAAVEQLRNDMDRLAKRNHEAVLKLAKQIHDNSGNTQLHLLYDETRQQHTLRESRSKG